MVRISYTTMVGPIPRNRITRTLSALLTIHVMIVDLTFVEITDISYTCYKRCCVGETFSAVFEREHPV